VTDITDHLAIIERRVAQALARAGRVDDDVLIVAVSKGQPAAAIADAHRAGIIDFGENYVDEALHKIESLQEFPLRWHFIGRIQSNKTRAIAEHFDCVHTLDRVRIAERLNAQRPAYAAPLDVLIQVNLESEPQKGGVEEAALGRLADAIDALPRLRLRGLMTIPPARLDEASLRDHFIRIARLAERYGTTQRALSVLSMGMSGDYELAIACGSSCVRIGTAIFGERLPASQ
jgi:hypothetical protein